MCEYYSRNMDSAQFNLHQPYLSQNVKLRVKESAPSPVPSEPGVNGIKLFFFVTDEEDK
jgi:hypothetical protein